MQVLPSPIVHANLAPLGALALADKQRAAVGLEVRLGEHQGLLNPKSSSPQHHDQRAQTSAMRCVAGLAHDGHNLLDPRWIGRIAPSFVPRWAARVMAG
jgi:hypothetical protein